MQKVYFRLTCVAQKRRCLNSLLIENNALSLFTAVSALEFVTVAVSTIFGRLSPFHLSSVGYFTLEMASLASPRQTTNLPVNPVGNKIHTCLDGARIKTEKK